ncbi:MAG: hypothetical protein IIB72_13375 [Proteobacteria bacterium]|nr:hypothetical protein [Pseudomonadota bacterium]
MSLALHIAKLADLGDFLIMAVVEPISIVVFFAAVSITGLIWWLEFRMRKKYPGYQRWLEKKSDIKFTDPIYFFASVSVFAVLAVQFLAVYNAAEIKSGNIDAYRIRISDPGELAAEQTLALLGTTTRFSLFYDNEKAEVLVVPVENISFMIK